MVGSNDYMETVERKNKMKNKYQLNPLTSLIETVNHNRLFDVMEQSEIKQVAKTLKHLDDLFKGASNACAYAYLLGIMQGEMNGCKAK